MMLNALYVPELYTLKGSTAERSRDVALGNSFTVQAICSLNMMDIVSHVSTTVVSIVKRSTAVTKHLSD